MATRLVGVTKKGYRVGEDHWTAVLTDQEVDRIRDLHEEYDLSYKQLAEMFGVSKSMIAGICQYRRRAQTPFGWKELAVKDEDVKET